MDEFIEIGEIVKPHGIAGELKIKKLTADPDRFKKLKVVYIDGKQYKILSNRDADEFIYLRFFGINDRTAAETLRGKFVSVDRVNAIDLNEGEYFIVDLIGCKIIAEDGKEYGEITDVASFGAADVIEAKGEKGIFRFPFLNKLISNIDTDKKMFFVKSDELEKVIVYED